MDRLNKPICQLLLIPIYSTVLFIAYSVYLSGTASPHPDIFLLQLSIINTVGVLLLSWPLTPFIAHRVSEKISTRICICVPSTARDGVFARPRLDGHSACTLVPDIVRPIGATCGKCAVLVELDVINRKSFPDWFLMTPENKVLEMLVFLVGIKVSDAYFATDSANCVASPRLLETCNSSVLKLDPISLMLGGNLFWVPPIERFYDTAPRHLIVFSAGNNPGAYTIEAVDRPAKIACHAGFASGLAGIPKCYCVIP